MNCSSHSEPALLQPFSDLLRQGSWVGIVIANGFYASIFKESVKILQSRMICNRADFSRGRPGHAHLQTGPQQHKVKGHFFQDFAGDVDVGGRYRKINHDHEPRAH